MIDKRHRAQVERKLQDAVSADKARIELGRLSKFGLLEMSRQRLRASLTSHSHIKCDHCTGRGQIKNPELVALEALRKMQAAVVVGHVKKVKARLPSMPAFFLLNNKRGEIAKLELDHNAQILILPDGRLRPDEYEFEMEGVREQPAPAKTAPEAEAKPAAASPGAEEETQRSRRGANLKPAANR
jgi:ribonuclease E